MDKKFSDYLMRTMSAMLAGVSIILAIYSLIDLDTEKYKLTILLSLILLIIIIEVIIIYRQRFKLSRRTVEVQKLDRLMEYSKKRKELDEEINLLTRELLHSSLSEYLDINRLVFEGQNVIVNNKSINYNSFFEQFGLLNEKIEVRKNSAVFLTSFNKEGEDLFHECQRILGGLDIFLQRTDNYVDKEDIMMNIISLIVQSEIVIVNINGRNANVYYELGISHAIGKPTILLSKTNFHSEDIGFDIRQKRIIMYSSINDLEKQLLYQISRLIK